jgi:hypothetical protein
MSEMWKRLLKRRRGWSHRSGTFTPRNIKPTKGTQTVPKGTKQAKMNELLRLYEQGKITAEEYAEEREKLGKSLEIRKKVKKQRSVRYKNVLIDQELGTEVKSIQQGYTDWKRKSEGYKLGDIGVTGRGHSKEGGKGSTSLFEHLEFHVQPQKQRPGAKPQDGVWQRSLQTMESLIQNKDAILDEKENDNLLVFIRRLNAMSNTKGDPRNIPFKNPAALEQKGDKWVVVKWNWVMGHYRTPDYVRKRDKVDGVKEKQSEVDSSWYEIAENKNGGKNIARPPMWQAIFSGSKVVNGDKGNLFDEGLLKILENFKNALEGAYLETVVIDDVGNFEEKINSLSKLTALKTELIKLINDKSIYRGGGHVVNYGVLLDRINSKVFDSNQRTSRYLRDIAPELKDIVGSEDIRNFKINIRKPALNRLINLWVRGEKKKFVPDHLGANGKPFVLSSHGGGRKYEGEPWSGGYSAALKNSQIKKSWIDSLWG